MYHKSLFREYFWRRWINGYYSCESYHKAAENLFHSWLYGLQRDQPILLLYNLILTEIELNWIRFHFSIIEDKTFPDMNSEPS